MKATIGNLEVPVREGPKSTVTFTGGARGPQEAGDYAFWTAIARVENGVEQGYTIRSLEHLPPGERHDLHPDDPRYDDMRQGLRNCLCIKPASLGEIESWLQGHRKDAAFATKAEIAGAPYRIEGSRLMPLP